MLAFQLSTFLRPFANVIQDHCFGFIWFNITGPKKEGQKPDITATFILLIARPFTELLSFSPRPLSLWFHNKNLHEILIIMVLYSNDWTLPFLTELYQDQPGAMKFYIARMANLLLFDFCVCGLMLWPCKAIETWGTYLQAARHTIWITCFETSMLPC